MKKITTVAALAAIASVSISANAAGVTTGIATAATVPSTIQLTATTDTSQVGGGLKETVNLQISAGNIAAVDYNNTANTYGYAVASTKGKGKYYSAASAGGAPVEDSTTPAGTVPTSTNVGNAAAARSGSTAGGGGS